MTSIQVVWLDSPQSYETLPGALVSIQIHLHLPTLTRAKRTITTSSVGNKLVKKIYLS